MQKLRLLLLPFSWLYGLVVRLRNKFFDWGWFSSKAYNFPVICVGNLSVGGTGKTPMIEYLIQLLKDDFLVATLSRGYKRKTTGFYLLKGEETVAQAGDEPLQFKTKFSKIQVAVDEDRQAGIAQLCQQKMPPEVILLDDAFQHRKVTPNFSILLTTYAEPYARDFVLPAGNLREPKQGAKRADVVVVTKCPADLSETERKKLRQSLDLLPKQQLYFSFINYANYITNGVQKMTFKAIPAHFCLVTGIAKPKPLVQFLRAQQLVFNHKKYADHHRFTEAEIAQLTQEKFVLTTEKDFMRLKNLLPAERLFYLPIQQDFIANKKDFDQEVKSFVEKNKRIV